MNDSSETVHIIGAGISGLVAAINLEKHGLKTEIYEQADSEGGRLKSDVIDGTAIDHGFQVLLTAYPYAKKYLDYEALELQEFKAGALLFGKSESRFGDPLRDFSFMWTTLASTAATLKDKYLIYKLSQSLKEQSFEDIFNDKDVSTMEYLKNFGFSQKVISCFFQPFYGGIFLENSLYTNSKLFCFIFKMFAEGKAAIPKAGIAAIPRQLKSRLKSTNFHFNTQVKSVNNQNIELADGQIIHSSATIVATEAKHLIGNLNDSEMSWKSCHCFYYEAEKNTINEQIIGLNNGEGIINNFHFLSPGSAMVSITITKDTQLSIDDLKSQVEKEMYDLSKIKLKRYIKHYHIAKALPDIENVYYDIDATQTQLLDHVFLAGDVLLNGSLNAAMIAGERAAEAVLIKKGLIKTVD